MEPSRGLCQRVWCLNVFPLNEIENKRYGLETKFDDLYIYNCAYTSLRTIEGPI